ncbi:hypothetical protein HYALB_00008294 [Hymenoscyphus albidus]|uniref:2EXR domain-containing protein n=1 Tax=Hymenoscyphus albidus TaxID=595503 RepID=A0A9N9LGP8_9HELO|nr:hypothetical protein HYALB_00008294 [Hymenoscyphus albidus]
MKPRVVPVFSIIGGKRHSSNVPGGKGPLHIHIGTTAPVPTVLHVHRESREFAQKRYKLAFGLDHDPNNGHIYFDFKRDILYIHSGDTRILAPRFNHWCCEEERMQVQRLAIQAPIKAHDDIDPLGPYPALRTLDIVLRNFHDPIPNIRKAFEKPITHAEMADLALLTPLFDDATDATRSTMRHGDTAVKRYRQRFEFCGEQDKLGDDRSLDECLQYLGPFQKLPPDSREPLYPKKEDVTIGIKVIGWYSTRRAVLKMAEGSDREQFADVVDENGRKLKKEVSEDETEGLPVADATKDEEATL